ncbi:MAG: GIY-YIG nuclease family protein [Mariniblastus sp.]|nr:GIY-YIG nuclease family protein [Mariniblastus sp.]
MPKLIEHQIPNFNGFGASILAQQTRGRIKRHRLPGDRMQARALLHDHCPLTPGVYGWLDDRNQLCYVGKSKSLRKRLLSYFSKTPADKKAARIRQHSQKLVWEPISNELLALIREQELIYRWRPEFNTQGQPTKRQPAFICIGGGMAPNAFFTRRLTDKSELSFGPIAGTGRLRSAVETINQCFQLRDCPDKIKFKFNNQLTLFENPITAQCIRFELGTCPAPCAAQCSSRAYQANVDHARQFILGKDRSILTRLDQQMQEASLSHSFEKAAIIRDHISNLNWLDRRMSALRNAQESYNGVLPIEARKKREAWLFLKGGQLIGSTVAPDTEERAIATIKRLTEVSLAEKPIPENLMEMNLQLILIAWFRKHPQLKNSLIPFGDAVDICEKRLDGGFLKTA